MQIQYRKTWMASQTGLCTDRTGQLHLAASKGCEDKAKKLAYSLQDGTHTLGSSKHCGRFWLINDCWTLGENTTLWVDSSTSINHHPPSSLLPSPHPCQNGMPLNSEPLRKALQSSTSFLHLSNTFRDVIKYWNTCLAQYLSEENTEQNPPWGFVALKPFTNTLFASSVTSHSSSNVWPLWLRTKSNKAIYLEKGNLHF